MAARVCNVGTTVKEVVLMLALLLVAVVVGAFVFKCLNC